MPFEIPFLVKYWSFRALKSISLVSRCRSAFLLENDGKYAFFWVRKDQTEVLNKGGTSVPETLKKRILMTLDFKYWRPDARL